MSPAYEEFAQGAVRLPAPARGVCRACDEAKMQVGLQAPMLLPGAGQGA